MPLDVLMIAYAAFAALAMAMKRHRPLFGGSSGPSPRGLRLAGVALLLFSFALAFYRAGSEQGSVAWLGGISLAALFLVLLMSWRPTAAFTLAVPALVLAGLLVLLRQFPS